MPRVSLDDRLARVERVRALELLGDQPTEEGLDVRLEDVSRRGSGAPDRQSLGEGLLRGDRFRDSEPGKLIGMEPAYSATASSKRRRASRSSSAWCAVVRALSIFVATFAASLFPGGPSSAPAGRTRHNAARRHEKERRAAGGEGCMVVHGVSPLTRGASPASRPAPRRGGGCAGPWSTPLSIVAPVRVIAWKYSSSPADLDDHEVVVAVEASGGHVRGAEVPRAQRATAAGHPVHDPALLGLDALVDVVVPGERGAHAVPDEERLQDRPRFEGRAVGPAGRVQGVVEEGDLPVGARGRELLRQPVELRLVQVAGVEREEAHAPLGHVRGSAPGLLERVVALASHVEGLVEAFGRVVVVAEHGTEDDSRVEERPVGRLELAPHPRGVVRPVDVVAEQEHEGEGEQAVERGHLLRHVDPPLRVPPHVADHGESNGAVGSRHGERADDGRSGRGGLGEGRVRV